MDAEAGPIASEAPEIVLTDVRMPGMDGIELLRLIRQRAPGIAVILMTAHDDLPTVATAMREGAVDFLVKPLELNRLRAVMRRVFEDREASRSAGPDKAVTAEHAGRRLVGHDPRMIEASASETCSCPPGQRSAARPGWRR